jgi:hypothetical protein
LYTRGAGAGQIAQTNNGRVDTDVKSIANAAIAAATFAANALDAVWSTATRTLTGFSTALAVSVWDVLTANIGTASSIGVQVKTNLDAVVSAIKAKTDQLTFTTANKVDATIQAAGDFAQAAADKVWSTAVRTLSAAGVQAIWDALTSALTTAGSIGKLLVDNVNATISSRASSAALATVQADTDDIQTRLPAALVGGRMDSNVGAINNNTGGVSALDRSTRAIVEGTVAAAATTTSIPTSSLAPAATVADQFKGRVIIFDENTTTAALRGQATDITANTNTGTLTVTALTTAPASGDTFVIL